MKEIIKRRWRRKRSRLLFLSCHKRSLSVRFDCAVTWVAATSIRGLPSLDLVYRAGGSGGDGSEDGGSSGGGSGGGDD